MIIEAQNLATETHNTFTYEMPNQAVQLQANVARLQTAVHSLIDNAFKLTKAGSVKLTASVDAVNVVVKISDTGIGIDAKELPTLFTEFHHSDGQNELQDEYGGEGIGLYLTKLVVEEHGGRVYVTSQPGKGSTFMITLPRHRTDI